MRDDAHAFTDGLAAKRTRPVKPFSVIERTRPDSGGPRLGKRTDTTTSSMRYALDRRDTLRRQGRPAYVEDVSGRRVERGWL